MTEASDWTGRVGDVWAAEWRRTDRSFGDLARRLDAAILAAAPRAGGRALDIGCGAGATSLALAAARPDIAVTGVDLSAALLDVARERGAGRANLAFVEGDALAAAAALAPVDLFFSRHGVMFFADPAAGFAALRAAAAPGGRLVFSCFRALALNAWADEVVAAVSGSPPERRDGAPGPFAFADEDRVAELLGEVGWRDARVEPVDYRWRAGEGDDPVADALGFLARIGPAAPLLRALPAAEREAALGRIGTLCAAHRHGHAIDFPAAAWLWSARA